MPFLNEVADYLSTNGVGTSGVDLFENYLPPEPNACVALYQTPGLGPVRAMRSGTGQVVAARPRLQVVTRSCSAAAAVQKAQDVYNLLEGLGDVTLGGVRYKWFGAVHEPGLMGRDEQGRAQAVVNFDVVKDSTSTR